MTSDQTQTRTSAKGALQAEAARRAAIQRLADEGRLNHEIAQEFIRAGTRAEHAALAARPLECSAPSQSV